MHSTLAQLICSTANTDMSTETHVAEEDQATSPSYEDLLQVQFDSLNDDTHELDSERIVSVNNVQP